MIGLVHQGNANRAIASTNMNAVCRWCCWCDPPVAIGNPFVNRPIHLYAVGCGIRIAAQDSSRSHAVFIITIEVRDKSTDVRGTLCTIATAHSPAFDYVTGCLTT